MKKNSCKKLKEHIKYFSKSYKGEKYLCVPHIHLLVLIIIMI